jgi:hypothetical protein
MATVTGLTADRMLAIEAASVIDGDVDGNGNLILTKHDGSQINAGSVIGPTGPQGPVGSMLPVLNASGILDMGIANQLRAGRQLSPADFAAIGLNAPLGLWNLSDLSDASGNGRALSNKGAVPFTSGINGIANTAAQFSGNSGQAFYIPDTGASDPFRIKTGSFGCWSKTARRGSNQGLVSKLGAAGNYGWQIVIVNNIANASLSYDGSNMLITPVTSIDICDDRWHFIVCTFDGEIVRLYTDGTLEGACNSPGLLIGSSAPFNIGSNGADSSTNASNPHYGRIDEVFVTADILSEDQVRMLYCVKIGHTLSAVPTRVNLNVRRRRKGGALAAADFPTQPLRLYNFSAGSLGDEGSSGSALTNNNAATSVAGVDGAGGNAFLFNGTQFLSSADTGLPSGMAPRSYGCWFRESQPAQTKMGWGTVASGDARIWTSSSGQITISSGADGIVGPYTMDGSWHFIVGVENNGALDGALRKMYLDGKLVGISTVLNPVVLIGAPGFKIGANPNTTADGKLIGEIDSVFVCNYALTAEQINALYAKGSQTLLPSPKNVGDHIEGMDAANLYATFDTLDSQSQIDLAVA